MICENCGNHFFHVINRYSKFLVSKQCNLCDYVYFSYGLQKGGSVR